MNLSRVYAIFLRQWFLFKSNPIRIASTFLWLIIDVFQWGFISHYLDNLGQASFSFVTVLLGAIILWEFLSRIQQGTMMAFLEDTWSHNFINYFGSPLQIKEYLAGLASTAFVTGIIGFIIMAILAGAAFGLDILKIGLLILPFLAILLIFGMAVGFFIAGLVFRYGPSAEWLTWPIPLVLSIFAGVYYPVSSLPVYFQAISKLIPASYVFESLRGILTSGGFSPAIGMNLAVGFFGAIAYFLASYFFFSRVYQRNLKTGGIARFSAQA